MDTDQLAAPNTLKLHGSAIWIDLETLATPDTKSLPPSLKCVYFYNTAHGQLIEHTTGDICLHQES